MTPDHINEILTICEASSSEGGFRELPNKTTLSLYLARAGVGLTVPSVEALAIKGQVIHARTNKGDLYVVPLEDVFAVNIEGRLQPKAARKAGFGA
jgi:hypothetical protein